MKMYSAALNRYLSAAKGIEMPWFAPVLGQLFKMGETAIITPSSNVEEKKNRKDDRRPYRKKRAYDISG